MTIVFKKSSTCSQLGILGTSGNSVAFPLDYNIGSPAEQQHDKVQTHQTFIPEDNTRSPLLWHNVPIQSIRRVRLICVVSELQYSFRCNLVCIYFILQLLSSPQFDPEM